MATATAAATTTACPQWRRWCCKAWKRTSTTTASVWVREARWGLRGTGARLQPQAASSTSAASTFTSWRTHWARWWSSSAPWSSGSPHGSSATTWTRPSVVDSALILLQTVPTHIQIDSLQRKLLQEVEGVLAVHEFHVWQLAGERIIASAHIRCKNLQDYMQIAERVKEFFHNEGIHSTTIQPEFVQLEGQQLKSMEVVQATKLRVICARDLEQAGKLVDGQWYSLSKAKFFCCSLAYYKYSTIEMLNTIRPHPATAASPFCQKQLMYHSIERVIKKTRKGYLIHWKGYSKWHCTLEPKRNLNEACLLEFTSPRKPSNRRLQSASEEIVYETRKKAVQLPSIKRSPEGET
ncbi:uncharacterized protein LOC144127783 isoform X12 [Amblyomma americanum]